MTTNADLRGLAVAALQAAHGAGDNIFSPRDWANYAGQLPVVLVQTPREEKSSLGRNVPQFNTIVVLRVTARCKAVASANDGGAAAAELAAEALKNAIEVALINDYNLTAVIQQFAWVRSTIEVTSEADYHVGQVVQEYGLEIYQGPEDFAPPAAVNLDEVTVTVQEPTHTIEPAINLTNLQS